MIRTSGILYFGYGSNLWKDQMKRRCPTSTYKGIARLNGYKWIINERGYANVVEVESSRDHTFGLVYLLKQADEDKLDKNEGVPVAYTKEHLEVDMWYWKSDKEPIDIGRKPEKISMLVYINRDQTQPNKPKEEYVYRMNKGIEDAVAAGVPRDYVNNVLRKYVPEKHDEGIEEFAQKQALEFEDET